MKLTYATMIVICLAILPACKRDADSTTAPEETAAAVSLEGATVAADLGRMMFHITELSSDEYGGREPMSEGEKLTLEFIESRFRNMGLEPLFGDSYRQEVEMV